MSNKTFLEKIVSGTQYMINQSFRLMKRNNGYDYLLGRYLFQIDSYSISQKHHKLRLKAIGNRATHNVNIFSVSNDPYLLSIIDPRDLVELGYRLFIAGKNQLMQRNYQGSFQRLALLFHGVHERIKSYFNYLLENEKTKNNYAYALVDRCYLEDDVTLTLHVKTTGLMLEILLSNLSKDLLLASQLEPRHLINIGYEMAERKINETFWNQHGILQNRHLI